MHDEPHAVDFYQNALSLKGLSKDEVREARRQIKELKKTLKKRPKKATLTVISNAKNALVRLDGVGIGRTPLTGVMISPGRHTLVVETPGFKQWKKVFTVAPFANASFAARLEDKPTDVLVHTEPSGATAAVTGQPECLTPCLLTLTAGSYTVSIERQGYLSMMQHFTKPPGQLLELRYALVPTRGSLQPLTQPGSTDPGFVVLTINVGAAQISVDGRPAGISPLSQPIELIAGPHQIAVSAPGFKSVAKNVEVVSGQRQQLNIRLEAWALGTTEKNNQPLQPTLAPARLRPLSARKTQSVNNSWAWTAIISGSTMILAGGGLTAGALITKNNFDMAELFKINATLYKSGVTRATALDMEKNAQFMMISAYALYGLGAAALTTGIFMYNGGGDNDPLVAPSLSIVPVFSSEFVGASTALRF
jgi:hypothetical protein